MADDLPNTSETKSGEVVAFPTAIERLLAKELGVSHKFVEMCGAASLAPSAAKTVLAWFLSLPMRERMVVAKNVLRARTQRATRRR